MEGMTEREGGTDAGWDGRREEWKDQGCTWLSDAATGPYFVAQAGSGCTSFSDGLDRFTSFLIECTFSWIGAGATGTCSHTAWCRGRRRHRDRKQRSSTSPLSDAQHDQEQRSNTRGAHHKRERQRTGAIIIIMGCVYRPAPSQEGGCNSSARHATACTATPNNPT